MATKEIANLSLSPHLRAVLQAVRCRLMAEFDIDRLVLFGSAAWGRPDEESDVDLLIVLNNKIGLETEDSISRAIFDINLEYETNLSELVQVTRSDTAQGGASPD